MKAKKIRTILTQLYRGTDVSVSIDSLEIGLEMNDSALEMYSSTPSSISITDTLPRNQAEGY